MNITVIGSGYVGLVTGVCLAEIGHKVVCADNNIEKIKLLKRARSPIYEPGLEDLLRSNIQKKRLSFKTSTTQAARKADVVFIAVGTPSKKDGEADLTFIEKAACEIAQGMEDYQVIVEKSTVPAQTGQRIQKAVEQTLARKNKPGKKINFDVASNPEFLREGTAIKDFMNPDRIVIGVQSKRAEKVLREVYKPLKANVIITDMNSAEMIKHASNSFLATKISFINAVSQICDRVGADILKVSQGMGLDKRIASDFLNAGIGYGGSCFPKDVNAFIHLSEELGYDFKLLKEVRAVNEEQRNFFVKLIKQNLWTIKNKRIGVLGLSFKPNTDDMRNAPCIEIIASLQKEGARLKVYDPQAMDKAKKIIKKVAFAKDAYDVAKDADCLLLLTEWPEFSRLNFRKIRQLMARALIFDGRNFYDKKELEKQGFEYFGIGIKK